MHTPTEEQAAIVLAASSTQTNLLVNALAGAAKTSTLELIAQALPGVEILCLAFNRKIAVEMQTRMPDNVKAMTLNSLGHRTWSDACGRRLIVESDKIYNLMSATIKTLGPDEQRAAYERMAELMRIVSFGKQCGYIPSGHYETVPKAKRLLNDDEFFDHIEQDLNETEMFLVREVTLASLRLAFEGKVDYDDQILMPTIFMGAFPRYQLTLVDEAQDLSALNHAMLRKMIGTRRLIAVGDPNQAIYGFRGAHENSMRLLQQEFDMKELALSISFRCPQAVVKHARWKASHMRWPDWAKEGLVETLATWSAETLVEDAAIICRNNAPLFRAAIRLLKNGRTCELDGRDITLAITKVMRKFGSSDLRAVDVLTAVDAWEVRECEKAKPRAHGGISDRAECMRIFAREAPDLGGALAYAQHLTQLHSPLKLLTGHKSKGLEFEHVYFLDQQLVKKEDQDPNLRYVIQTRAKDTLTYITSDGFVNTVKEKIDAEV